MVEPRTTLTMTIKKLFVSIAVTFFVVSAGIGSIALMKSIIDKNGGAFSGAGDNTLYAIDNSTSVQIGKDVSTQLIATNTARRFLRISNTSGATTTPTPIFCNTNGRSAVLNSGLFMEATSSLAWPADAMYTGALNCRGLNATGTVTILEM